jgi:hypothetical protein
MDRQLHQWREGTDSPMSKHVDEDQQPPEIPEVHVTNPARAREAAIIRDLVFPACMAASLGLSEQTATASGFKVFLDKLKEDAGAGDDPIVAMLLEQLALAHLRIADLHSKAQEARQLEAVAVYSSAAARLTGEFRRCALALKKYRAPNQATTVIHRVEQANVSHAQQNVSYEKGGAGSTRMTCHDGELDNTEAEDDDPFGRRKGPPSRRGRPAEPSLAGSLDG